MTFCGHIPFFYVLCPAPAREIPPSRFPGVRLDGGMPPVNPAAAARMTTTGTADMAAADPGGPAA